MWIENQNAITALDGAVAVGGAVTVAQLLEAQKKHREEEQSHGADAVTGDR